jgi:hypothetical protein
VVAGSNPAVPTFAGFRSVAGSEHTKGGFLETLYLLLGIIGFFLVIAVFFFGGFVILDFLFSRFSREP